MPSRRCVLSAAATGSLAAVAGHLPAGPPAHARPDDTSALCEVDVHRPKRQLRGLWIATVVNLNWPSRPGLSVEQQQAELSAWFDLAVERRYNAVVLQVRSAAQVLYESALEPWSAYLSGTQGRHPGYDPLAYAVREAHVRGLELHAWFNPYQMVRAGTNHNIAANHSSKLHPEWGVHYAGGTYFNPGIPQARAWVQDAIMVAVEKYDIDAVHVDDYFYPYPVAGQVFDDSAAYAEHGGGLSLEDWRRHNVNLLVSELGERIKLAKPWVKWGISPFAIWRNASTDPDGSSTNGLQSYDAIFADTREWVRREWVDYITPQVYWSQDFAVASYRAVVDWWCEQVRGKNVSLYIGEAAYKIGTTSPAGWSDPAEMSGHLGHCATRPEVQGNVYFSIPYVRDDALSGMSIMERTWYSRPALVPPMPWIDAAVPPAPAGVHAQRQDRQRVITVRDGAVETVRYAIYRLPATRDRITDDDCRLADATHLVAVVPADSAHNLAWIDPDPDPAGSTYVVTALDRLWNESAPAQVTIT